MSSAPMSRQGGGGPSTPGAVGRRSPAFSRPLAELLGASSPRATLASVAPQGPAERYYRRLAGVWAGELQLARADLGALVGAPLPLGLKLRWAAQGLGARALGPARLSTFLRPGPDGDHLHGTRLRRGGLILFSSEERIRVHPDGRAITMTGRMSFWPWLQRSEPYEAQGEVDAAGLGARYRIPFLGAELVQTTELVSDGLVLRQDTPWSQGSVRLRSSERF